MFWGLIMEPKRRYTQQVKKAFHISMAAMDLSNSEDEPAQVMCTHDGRNYLLCTLTKERFQCPLDLNFDVGNEVSFASNGKSLIHLTGYLVEDAEDFGEETEEEEEEIVEMAPRKAKRTKTAPTLNGPPVKKSKNNIEVSSTQVAVEDEEESEDSDFDLEKALEAATEEDEDTSFGDEEVDDEEDGEEESDEEEDEDSDEEEEEEEKEEAPPKMNGSAKKQNKQEVVGKQKKEQQQPASKKKTLAGGVIIEDIKEGQGKPAKSGRFVNVYYEGRLKQNNKLFDSTSKGAGFSFRLGAGEVIKGWDIGVAGMKVGGKRRIICPPGMAYGVKGSPPAIPPNSTLVFEVELKKIN